MRIEVSLPWLLAKAAKRLLPISRKEATLLLGPASQSEITWLDGNLTPKDGLIKSLDNVVLGR